MPGAVFMQLKNFALTLAAYLPLITCDVQAKNLTIVDPAGKPVVNAVVSVTSDSTPAAGTAVMDQVDKQFVPHVLAVPAGTSVTFPNSDNIRHHVYSFSQAKPFEIKLYSGLSADPVEFDKPGIVALGCNIHDQMIGYVYVYENARVFITGNDGSIVIPDGVQSVTLWHPELDIVQSRQETVSLDESAGSESITLTLKAAIPAEPAKKSRTFGSKKFGN